MSDVAVAQHHRPSWPDLTDFFSGLPSWANLRPMLSGHLIKVAEDHRDGEFVLQAEIPGVNPDEDVDVVVRDGVLTITAQRSETKESNGHSEFSYGSFTRSVTLPATADEDGIKASYDKGILTVSVPLKQPATPEKHVTIESAS